MKVLHVVRGLANSSGFTHVIVPLTEELARQGCDVTILYVDKANAPAVEPSHDLVKSHGYPLSLPFSNPGVSFSFANAIKKRIYEFDVVHVHAVWNFPTYYTMRVALKANVPYLVAPQGSFEPWALRQNHWGKILYGRFTEVPLLKRAAFMQAVTTKEVEQFKSYGIDAPSVVIPNGISEDLFPPRAPRLANRLGLPNGQKTLLFLSRIHPKKGLDVLIDAFARFLHHNQDVTLVIAGHDAGSGYEESIRSLIARHGVAENALLIGEVKGNTKYEILTGTDAFVLPSHSEGLPVAVLDAMAAGLPVVVTPGCNIPEVEKYEAGYIVAPNSNDITNALLRLFGDPARAKRMGDNGRRLVQENFSWERIAKQMIDVYEVARSTVA